MKYFVLVLVILMATACNNGGDSPNDAPAEINPAEITLQAINRATSAAQQVIGEATLGDALEGTLPDINPVSWTLEVETGDRFLLQVFRQSEAGGLSFEMLDPQGVAVADIDILENSFAVTDPLMVAEAGTFTLILSASQPDTDYSILLVDMSPTETPEPSNTPTETPEVSPTPSSTPTERITPTRPIPTSTPAPTLTPDQPGGRLEVNITRALEMSQPGESHRFTFLGTTGETLAIAVNPDPVTGGSFDPYLELQAPNGEVVAENNNWRQGIRDAFIRYTFDTTGVYTVFLRSADDAGTGRYLITLTDGFTVRDVERGEPAHNASSVANLETYGVREVWTIPLQAGTTFEVDVRATDPAVLNVMVEVVAPNGEVWFDDNSGIESNAYLGDIIAPVNGNYIIHIAANNNASIGQYSLFWRRQSDFFTPVPTLTRTPTQTFTPSQTFTPTITLTPTAPTPGAPRDTFEATIAPGETYVYYVEAAAGETLNVVVIGRDGFDAVLRISDPIGSIIVEVDDVGESKDPRARTILEDAGLYRLEISGFEGSGGSFTLNYILQ